VNLEGLTEKRRGKKSLWYENDDGEIVAKRCSKCSKIKSLIDYGNHARCLGGRNSECKMCVEKYKDANRAKAAETSRNWRKNNPDRYKAYVESAREVRKEYGRNWRKANKDYNRKYYEENKDSYRQRARNYYEDNKTERKEYRRTYYEENKERCKLSSRTWAIDNSDKKSLYSNRYRARKKGLPNTLTSEQYAKTLEYFGNACAITGRTDSIEKEHAIPLSVGHGGTTFENCYPMANGLNQSKCNSNIFEWFEANRQRFKLEQWRFDSLIEWLGKANGMTVEEYRDYVYECHANPNVIDDAKAN
jgi:hypothetical protein